MNKKNVDIGIIFKNFSFIEKYKELAVLLPNEALRNKILSYVQEPFDITNKKFVKVLKEMSFDEFLEAEDGCIDPYDCCPGNYGYALKYECTDNCPKCHRDARVKAKKYFNNKNYYLGLL